MLSAISLIPLSNVSLSVVCLLFRLFLLLFCLRISRWHNGPEETVSSSQVYSCCVLKFDFLLTVTRTCTNFVTISSYMLCKANIESLINYKGARITHLHFHDKFHQQRRSNVPSFEHCHVVVNKFHALSRLSRDLNAMPAATVICWKQNNASFHAKKKTNFFIRAKCPSQAITHANTTECLCLSHSVVFKRLRPRPKHFLGPSVTPWRLRVKQDNWVNIIYSRLVATVMARDG